MPQTGRGRRIHPEVRARIETLAALGWKPGHIEEKLGLEEGFEDRVPSKRTIEAIVASIRRRRPGQAWGFAEAGPTEARLVLPVLREAIEQSGGRITSFDSYEAEWIARIVAAVPDIPAASALLRAQAIASVERDDGPVGDAEQALQMFLAFRPWEDKGVAYVEARMSRMIPAPKTSAFDPLFDPSVRPAFNSYIIVNAAKEMETTS